MKIITGEECAPQHNLLVCNLVLNFKIPLPIPLIAKRWVWRLRDPDIRMDFCYKTGTLSGSYDSARTSSEEIGSELEKNSLLRTTEGVRKWTKKNIC